MELLIRPKVLIVISNPHYSTNQNIT